MPRTTLPSALAPTITSQDNVGASEARDMSIGVIVAAIVCAFLCALGLNSMLQCVFRCANRALTEPVEWVTARRLDSGLNKKQMVALPTLIYLTTGSPSSGCAICLTDYKDGDAIRVLPDCNHRFHVLCVDKWLLSHSSCPTCRNRVKPKPSIDKPCTV